MDNDWSILPPANDFVWPVGDPEWERLFSPGVSLRELIHPDDRARVQQVFGELGRGRETFDIRYRLAVEPYGFIWAHHVGAFLPAIGSGEPSTIGMFFHRAPVGSASQAGNEQLLDLPGVLHHMEQVSAASFDLRLTIELMLQELLPITGAQAAGCWLSAPMGDKLSLFAARGYRWAIAGALTVPISLIPAGRVVVNRKPVKLSDYTQSLANRPEVGVLALEGFRGCLGMPLIARGKLYGVLELSSLGRLALDEAQVTLVEIFVARMAAAIEQAVQADTLRHVSAELDFACDTTLEAWADVLEASAREPQGHTHRVSALALAVANRMNIPSERQDDIRRGALIHDIGTLKIPESLFLKPLPLDSGEWKMIRRHPVFALEILSPLTYLRGALDIPLYHHERWDGAGYPHQLATEQIPLAARVFSVVDTWDILTSARPYRRPFSAWQAREIMRSSAGSQFDPRVVDALEWVLEHHPPI